MQGVCAGGKESRLMQGLAWEDVPGAWGMLSVSPPRTLEESGPLREQHFTGSKTKAETDPALKLFPLRVAVSLA